jgi:gamma-glutamyl-gamma-aminobutyrate hydrolase PuuD
MLKLGVLPYGDQYGYPFDRLFSGIKSVVSPVDLDKDIGGVVFWGGADIFPGFYGQKANSRNQCQGGPSRRDAIEWSIMQRAVKMGIPIIGVCRGAQMLCALDGGTLIQHVDGHGHGGHHIRDKLGDTVYSNSCHHQMMQPREGEDNEVLMWTVQPQGKNHQGEGNKEVPVPEKEPEIVHFKQLNALGIQGHPEWMEGNTDFVGKSVKLIKERLL